MKQQPLPEIEPEFSKLPDDLTGKIFSYLDSTSLLRQRCLSRSFRRMASDSSLWENLCRILWKSKVHVSRQAQNLVSSNGLAAYRIAVEDAKNRDYITQEEICYDPVSQRGTIWSIRFKEAAGPDWTSSDPWWNYLRSRKIVFLEDGRVKVFVPRRGNESQQSLPVQERGSINTELSLLGMDPTNFRVEQQQGDMPHGVEWEGDLNEPVSPMTWRFITEPLDLPERPFGSYVRINVGGRDVPTYCCRRSPTGNWGFVMESCWGVCATFELPPRPRTTRHRRLRRRLRRAHSLAGNEIIVQVQVDESSEDEDNIEGPGQDQTRTQSGDVLAHSVNQNRGVRNEDLLVVESSFNVTISLQWREAFLYNVGEDTLPEGPNAMREFQRVYENTMADR